MASTFFVYLQLGARHIADLQGYDHILFVAALVAAWTIRAWRRLLLLVTAFTIGHSVTLALATLRIITVDSTWVEFLIPVTIAITSAGGIVQAWQEKDAEPQPATTGGFGQRYAVAVLFGLIHGLGFSNFLRAALGQEESLFLPLLAFNVGLELGQLGIVALVLLAGLAATALLRISRRIWVIGVSAAIFLVAVQMAFQRVP